MKKPNILIGGQEYPKKGWAIIFAGGSASGKSTLIRDGRLKFEGETLSTDTLGEEIIEVHNHAVRYAKEDPKRLAEAEKLVAAGMQSRYPENNVLNKVQNLILDFQSITVSPGKVSTILSNGAHAQKEAFFKRRIHACAEAGMSNLLLDMTGKEKEVRLYTDELKAHGYRVALVWVITNRSVALLWNHRRQRSMKVGAVHTGHDGPNCYLLDALQDGRLSDIDDAWLVFNSTESIRRPMTEQEMAESAVHLDKQGGNFMISSELDEKVRRVLGPNPPSAEKENAETPQWQMDETGKAPMIVDKEFFEKYTQVVTLPDGTQAHALLQLRSSADKKKGGLVVIDDKKGGTGLPKLQQCNAEDTPTYPYVIYTEADMSKRVQRRHGMMHRFLLKYEKTVNPNSAKYVSDDWMEKMFARIHMAQKVARDRNIAEPQIEDIIPSFLDADKKEAEQNIKQFYKELGIKEPEIPVRPIEVYAVNPPVREQFRSDQAYQQALALYPQQKEDYEKGLKEWQEYNQKFQ